MPAAQTVLVTTTPHTALVDVEQRIRELLATADVEAAPEDEGGGRIVQIPVRYDGDDLDDVAALLGIGVDEVIAEHTTQIWRCAFIGFAPGFGYLESSRTGLAVPRRTESRTAVPAGAVALADGYSAVYPRRSPGGWQIIGTTGLALWDLNRPEPALLHPGTRVQFVDEARR